MFSILTMETIGRVYHIILLRFFHNRYCTRFIIIIIEGEHNSMFDCRCIKSSFLSTGETMKFGDAFLTS